MRYHYNNWQQEVNSGYYRKQSIERLRHCYWKIKEQEVLDIPEF